MAVRNDFKLGVVRVFAVEPDVWVANKVARRGMKTGSNGPSIRDDALRAGLREFTVTVYDFD